MIFKECNGDYKDALNENKTKINIVNTTAGHNIKKTTTDIDLCINGQTMQPENYANESHPWLGTLHPTFLIISTVIIFNQILSIIIFLEFRILY